MTSGLFGIERRGRGYELRSLAAFEQAFNLDMNAFARHCAMALAGGEQCPRLLGALGFDEPFLKPRHQDRRVENSSPALGNRVRLRYGLAGKRWHRRFPRRRIDCLEILYRKNTPHGTNRKRRCRRASDSGPERGMINVVVNMVFSRSLPWPPAHTGKAI